MPPSPSRHPGESRDPSALASSSYRSRIKSGMTLKGTSFRQYKQFYPPLLSLLAGTVTVAAMPPWSVWPVLFIGYGLFFFILSGNTTKRGALLTGFLFALGFHLFGLAWIGNALLVEGNDYQWAWPLAVMGLPLMLAPFTALGALIAHLALKKNLTAGFPVFLAALAGTEWLRGHLFTGFPWNLAGYAWADILPVAQLAALGGIYFLTLMTIFWATLPGFLYTARLSKKLSVLIALLGLGSFGLCYGWGTQRLADNPTVFNEDIIVQIVQPNIAQEDKWESDKISANLSKLLQQSLPRKENSGKTTLIIWPETALSYYLLDYPSVREALKTTLALYDSPVYLLSGVLRRTIIDDEKHYYNSLVAYDRELFPLTLYDKGHLVPFGEYIPFKDYIPLAPVAGFEGFVAGNGPQSLSLPDLPSFSPLICYEVIFPGAAVDRQNRPEWIVTVTNDGWYGDSAGPHQHFAQARFRAIEEGLPVIRSANTGISGVTDSYGRIIAQAPLLQEKRLTFALPSPSRSTPFYFHSADTLFSASIFALLLVALSIFSSTLSLQKCRKKRKIEK